MGQKGRDAATKGAPTGPSMEESALDMAQRSSFAVMRDAATKPKWEESAGVMGERTFAKLAVMKVAPTMQRKEESVLDMEQRRNCAAMRDVPT